MFVIGRIYVQMNLSPPSKSQVGRLDPSSKQQVLLQKTNPGGFSSFSQCSSSLALGNWSRGQVDPSWPTELHSFCTKNVR